MRIGLVARFFDLRNGGIGRFSAEMLEGLKRAGCDIVPVSTERSTSIGHAVYATFEMPFRLPKGCDVYHSLTPLEAIHTPKELGVVTFHDLIPWLHVGDTDTHYARGPLKKLRDLAVKHYFKGVAGIAGRSRFIACNSEYTRTELLEHVRLDESKVSIIRFGISRGLEPKPKKDSVFRIGTLSYLDPRKRIDLLIQAFQAANVDGELVIGGAGSDYARLKKLAGDDPRIKFVGFVPDEALADFYNSLDLFVFPTKIEGYGLPIVEAFACKKPVVVLADALLTPEIRSRCTVVDDLNGFLRNPQSVGDVASNYSFAMTHDWDACVKEYLNLYQRVLEDR